MELQVRVVAAEGLVAADRGGTSDPFVALSFQDGAPLKKTAVVRKTLDPTWNQVGLTRARARARALSLSLSLSLALSLSLSLSLSCSLSLPCVCLCFFVCWCVCVCVRVWVLVHACV